MVRIEINMQEPSRETVNHMPGMVVLEFGATWCPHCQAIRGTMADALLKHPSVQHVQIEDGKGKPLGRSFKVKLWPTLVFMRDGQVVSQVVRPSPDEIMKGFAELATG